MLLSAACNTWLFVLIKQIDYMCRKYFKEHALKEQKFKIKNNEKDFSVGSFSAPELGKGLAKLFPQYL